MTAIEWTDVTWNLVTGCSRVSPGCAHCYARSLAPRIENQRWVVRADRLREVPAAVRFISAEPLLGRLDGLDLTGSHWS